MGSAETRQLASIPDYAVPSLDEHGNWGTAGSHALRKSLRAGSTPGVISLLKSMDAGGLVTSLRETGFHVSVESAAKGRAAVFSGVQKDLSEAVKYRVDGKGLAVMRQLGTETAKSQGHAFAAKEQRPSNVQRHGSAAQAVQALLSAEQIHVDILGPSAAHERSSLHLIAGQALKQGVQGFGFEGVGGKYRVDLTMSDIVDLHRCAAQAVAIESARAGLATWANGEKVQELSDWVPDSVQRLLLGSLSLAATQAVVNAIEGGSIAKHAGEIGEHGIAAILQQHGLDINAPTVKDQAHEQGLRVIEPDRGRGQYFGPVVAMDHRAALIKRSQTEVIELPFADLPENQPRPKLGDAVLVGFKAGVMSLNYVQRPERGAVER